MAEWQDHHDDAWKEDGDLVDDVQDDSWHDDSWQQTDADWTADEEYKRTGDNEEWTWKGIRNCSQSTAFYGEGTDTEQKNDDELITDGDGTEWWQDPDSDWWWGRASPDDEWSDKPNRFVPVEAQQQQQQQQQQHKPHYTQNHPVINSEPKCRHAYWPIESSSERRERARLATARPLVSVIESYKEEATALRAQQHHAMYTLSYLCGSVGELKEIMNIAVHQSIISSTNQDVVIKALESKVRKGMEVIEDHFTNLSARMQDAGCS